MFSYSHKTVLDMASHEPIAAFDSAGDQRKSLCLVKPGHVLSYVSVITSPAAKLVDRTSLIGGVNPKAGQI